VAGVDRAIGHQRRLHIDRLDGGLQCTAGVARRFLGFSRRFLAFSRGLFTSRLGLVFRLVGGSRRLGGILFGVLLGAGRSVRACGSGGRSQAIARYPFFKLIGPPTGHVPDNDKDFRFGFTSGTGNREPEPNL
jgi:hypothetical protein